MRLSLEFLDYYEEEDLPVFFLTLLAAFMPFLGAAFGAMAHLGG